MMRRFWLGAGMLLGASAPALAEKADAYQPTVISYGALDVDDVRQQKVLTGGVKLSRGSLEGGKQSEEVQGEFIEYDSRKENYRVRNTASGEDKPGAGFGTLVLQLARTEAPATTGKK